MNKLFAVIIGSGSYIPTQVIANDHFLNNEFYGIDGIKIESDAAEIIKKFKKITSITERRYVTDDLVASDISYFAAKDAIESSGVDKESFDYIIVAHNWGDIRHDNRQIDTLPSIAARVKNKLKIENPHTVAYDILFGCPGWIQGLIQANYYIKSGEAKRILVIGVETLSRVGDPHDRDTMLYADGAGCVILEAAESATPVGIISHVTETHALKEVNFLKLDRSYNEKLDKRELYLKMEGHNLYEYALTNVPPVIKRSIEKAGLTIADIKKVLIHQANEKMLKAILNQVFMLYDEKNNNKEYKELMPITISWLGNSSVATVPILLDLILKNNLDGHKLNKNDYTIFASVGAGMSINSLVYKF